MAENVLEKIIKKKSEKIVNLKKTITLDSLNELIDTNKTFINFKEKIENNIKEDKFSIIAEIKKASPSAGVIIKDYDPVKIANIYNDNRASCLSVLTEEDFFLGNLIHISKIKQKVNLPILCKDFFVDKFQIPLAKSYGSDAILLDGTDQSSLNLGTLDTTVSIADTINSPADFDAYKALSAVFNGYATASDEYGTVVTTGSMGSSDLQLFTSDIIA